MFVWNVNQYVQCAVCAVCCPTKNPAELADLLAVYKRNQRQAVWCVWPPVRCRYCCTTVSVPASHLAIPTVQSQQFAHTVNLISKAWSVHWQRNFIRVECTVATLRILYYGHITCFTEAKLRLFYCGHINYIVPWSHYAYSTMATLRLLYRGHIMFTVTTLRASPRPHYVYCTVATLHVRLLPYKLWCHVTLLVHVTVSEPTSATIFSVQIILRTVAVLLQLHSSEIQTSSSSSTISRTTHRTSALYHKSTLVTVKVHFTLSKPWRARRSDA